MSTIVQQATKKTLGSILLVAGVTIGGGMLGMPILTGFAGFIPSLLVMALTWAFLLLTGFLIADVNLQHSGDIVSMAHKTLGKWGRVFSWITYLFLLYALDVAFLAAGSKILEGLFPMLSPVWFPLLIAVPLAFVLSLGIRATDWVNRVLVFGKLLGGYGILVFLVPPHVQTALLQHVDFSVLPFTLPVVVQAFGFHTVIPSLVTYLDRDISKIRLSLTVGTLIGLVVYAFWELLVLGVVPLKGAVSIESTYLAGDVATAPLIHLLHSPLIASGATIFAFCGIGTAFLGVTLGLIGFIKDGFSLPRNRWGEWTSHALTFAPPLLFVYMSPSIFLEALSYAGALVAVICGLFPIAMAWRLPAPSYWRSRRGRCLLLGGALFFALTIASDVFNKIG